MDGAGASGPYPDNTQEVTDATTGTPTSVLKVVVESVRRYWSLCHIDYDLRTVISVL